MAQIMFALNRSVPTGNQWSGINNLISTNLRSELFKGVPLIWHPKMKLIIDFIVLCAVLRITASEHDRKREDNTNSFEGGMLGPGLELVLNKLESIEHKLHKLENRVEQRHTEMFIAIEKLEHQVTLNLCEANDRNLEKVHATLHNLDQDVDNVHNIIRQIINALPQLQQLNEVFQNQCSVAPTENSVSSTMTTTPKPKQPIFSSCKDVPSNVSGTYLISVKNDSEPFQVYCEQKSFGGGWIVFQYRYDGSLDFYRGWNEFRDGFGDLNKEFWLGLEKIHQLTSGRKHELIVELKDFDGTYVYARYNAFEIGTESDQYVMNNIGSYNGTAGDAMFSNKDEKFSTKDRDNDASSVHCAQYHEGAWWHWHCTLANLNGRYINANERKSMHWYYFEDNKQGLSYSRMMIRELE